MVEIGNTGSDHSRGGVPERARSVNDRGHVELYYMDDARLDSSSIYVRSESRGAQQAAHRARVPSSQALAEDGT